MEKSAEMECVSGAGAEDSAAPPASGGACAASKYAGCKGGGAGSAEASAGFLRRCMRSRIHLRMQGF
jgi:hypothetical protein